MVVDKIEVDKLRTYFDIPDDKELNFENLFNYAVDRLEPSNRFPIGTFRNGDWLKIEFLYHGNGNYLDCYIRFSDTKEYAGAGCGLHWRPYEDKHIALARALLQAIDIAERNKRNS